MHVYGCYFYAGPIESTFDIDVDVGDATGTEGDAAGLAVA